MGLFPRDHGVLVEPTWVSRLSDIAQGERLQGLPTIQWGGVWEVEEGIISFFYYFLNMLCVPYFVFVWKRYVFSFLIMMLCLRRTLPLRPNALKWLMTADRCSHGQWGRRRAWPSIYEWSAASFTRKERLETDVCVRRSGWARWQQDSSV